MMYGKILSMVASIREAEGRESKKVPDELIEIEQRIREQNARIARAQAIEAPTHIVENLVRDRTELKEKRDRLIKVHNL